MQPIFPEYIRFLNDNGVETPWFRERTFWMDNNVVKAFRKSDGRLLYLHHIYVDDDLNATIKKHKEHPRKPVEYETWDETILRMKPHIDELEERSVELLRSFCLSEPRRIIALNSTGKDSMVTTHLAKKARLNFETCFNVTTLDVKESNRMAKRNGFTHIYPDPQYGGFYQYITRYDVPERERERNWQMTPSRLNRFCCNYFKESPTIDNFDADEKLIFLLGMRNEESQRRANYTDVWRNEKWGDRDWIGLLPIRGWSELDVWLYILSEGIEINDKYRYGYDRVGCGIACPNYTKYTWAIDKYWYPVMFQRWRDILKRDFIRNNKWLIMNCTVDEYCKKAWPGGVYRAEPTEEVINEFAEYNNLDPRIGAKFFNHYCENGCLNKRREPLKIKDKETLAMNMKMFPRRSERFLCKKCLMKEFNWTQEDWDAKVEHFKSLNCMLF